MVQNDLDAEMRTELERLRQREAEKKLLYDRTIGGPDAPRPSVEFIRKNIGPLKSEAEILREAKVNVEQRQQEARREADRKAVVERSIREHNRSIEDRRHVAQKQDEGARKQAEERAKAARERMEQARLQREAQKNLRGRDRT